MPHDEHPEMVPHAACESECNFSSESTLWSKQKMGIVPVFAGVEIQILPLEYSLRKLGRKSGVAVRHEYIAYKKNYLKIVWVP